MMFSEIEMSQDWHDLMDAIDQAPIVVPCQNTDPDLWFPDKDKVDEAAVANNSRIAKKLCRQCPVQAECLRYALGANEVYGIWGGLSFRERMAMRSKRPWKRRQ